MFINDIINLPLFSHKKWNHEIILKNYLNENLKKRYIKFLIFSAGYLIFFVLKKTENFDCALIINN